MSGNPWAFGPGGFLLSGLVLGANRLCPESGQGRWVDVHPIAEGMGVVWRQVGAPLVGL